LRGSALGENPPPDYTGIDNLSCTPKKALFLSYLIPAHAFPEEFTE
jgi:hypothetical protein